MTFIILFAVVYRMKGAMCSRCCDTFKDPASKQYMFIAKWKREPERKKNKNENDRQKLYARQTSCVFVCRVKIMFKFDANRMCSTPYGTNEVDLFATGTCYTISKLYMQINERISSKNGLSQPVSTTRRNVCAPCAASPICPSPCVGH